MNIVDESVNNEKYTDDDKDINNKESSDSKWKFLQLCVAGKNILLNF